MRPRQSTRTRSALTAAVGVCLLVVGFLVGIQRASATAGPSSAPDKSTTIILSDARSIALRQWFAATDAGTASQANRSFTWTAPSTTDSVDVVVIGGGGGGGGGKGGNHGNTTSPNERGAGGGGGGGGETRRDSSVSVTPGETLSAQVGAGGASGTGVTRYDLGNNPSPGNSGGDGQESWLKRADTTVIVQSSGGTGGSGGSSTGLQNSTGGAAGVGGSGGAGGTLLTAGVDGVAGGNSTTAPSAAAAVSNSGSDWLYHSLRLGAGGGGGGGKSSNGGSTNSISAGTTASTASVYNLSNLAATITRIGGDGDGGNNQYVSLTAKHAAAHLGGGGGGGAFVFSGGRDGGRGGSGSVIMTYSVADLITSEITPADSTIPVTTGSTTITLQLRDAAGTATNVSVGPIEMFSSGASATLGSVTDNGDGTYSVTLSAGATAGTATITARVVGSDFTDSAQVVINDPSATTTTASGSTAPPGKPGTPTVTPTNGGLQVTVGPPTSGGTPTSYEITAQPGGRKCTVTGATGSCTVSGLSSMRGYRVSVVASNAGGDSPRSDASALITPLAADGSGGDLASTGIDPRHLLGLGLALAGAGLLLTAMSDERQRISSRSVK